MKTTTKNQMFSFIVCLLYLSSTTLCIDIKSNADNSTTTTTNSPPTTTLVPVTTTTTTTNSPHTTTLVPVTTTTTTIPTTTPAPDSIFSFNVTSNNVTCLRARFSFEFNITYLASYNNETYNTTTLIPIDSIDSYNGACINGSLNTLNVNFRKNWNISMEYTLTNGVYQLDTIRLVYVVDNSFPNVSQNEIGQKSVSKSGLDLFSANTENSYKCISLSTVDLSDKASLQLKNYQAEPFIKDPKTNDFDTAIECPADISNTSKLVPIIVGSALAVLVVLVLIAYIIGRRKHRPGYQQV